MTHLRWIAQWLLGLFLAAAGVLHLTVARQEFQAQVPSWSPIDADVVVVVSGVVEVLLGFALIALPKARRLVGAVVALYFLAIFPGNLAQYADGVDAFGLDSDRARLIRLFFQPVLVLWALWSATVWPRPKPTPRRAREGRSPRG